MEELGREIGRAVKVVFVAPDLQQSVDDMEKEQRDQVIMVRVDEATLRQLDACVRRPTRSRAVPRQQPSSSARVSEVRRSELEELEDALADVDRARERLHERVKEVFGGTRTPSPPVEPATVAADAGHEPSHQAAGLYGAALFRRGDRHGRRSNRRRSTREPG